MGPIPYVTGHLCLGNDLSQFPFTCLERDSQNLFRAIAMAAVKMVSNSHVLKISNFNVNVCNNGSTLLFHYTFMAQDPPRSKPQAHPYFIMKM